ARARLARGPRAAETVARGGLRRRLRLWETLGQRDGSTAAVALLGSPPVVRGGPVAHYPEVARLGDVQRIVLDLDLHLAGLLEVEAAQLPEESCLAGL